MRLLSEPNNRREVYQAVIDSLRWAAGWAMDLLDAEALLRIAELDSLAPYRSALLRDVIEPCLYAAERLPSDLSRRLMQLYGEAEPDKYCVYYLHGKDGLSKELHDRFRLHGQVANRLGRGRRRILVVHNIGDRQGDEIVRIVPLA